jgi:poly [ADP-ribose] polymerase
MFGPGLYWADDWGKSAGYCSLNNGYYSRGSGSVRNRGAFMFIADVALGKSHVADDAHGYTKAPTGTHSVFGKAGHTGSWGGSLMNNEFITYNNNQNRLRYLVEFEA